MSEPDHKNDDLTFGGYVNRQLTSVATIAALMAAGWFGGRGASHITGFKGPKFEFLKEFNVHFLEKRLASHRTDDGIIPLSYIGAIAGGMLGGLYHGFKGWKSTQEHRQHIETLADKTKQAVDADATQEIVNEQSDTTSLPGNMINTPHSETSLVEKTDPKLSV